MVRTYALDVLKLGYRVVTSVRGRREPLFARAPVLSKLLRSIAILVLGGNEAIYTIQGHKMHIPADDTSLYIYTLDDYEPIKTEVFIDSLRAGDVAVDVGAHIGYYTLLAARRVGQRGVVFAFEPDPANYKLLNENIRLNNYENVVAVQKAVTNKTGSATLFLNSSSSKNSLFLAPRSCEKRTVVETVSLDDFFSEYPPSLASRIKLIKMDVEGAEMLALLGMSQLVKDKQLTLLSDVAAHQITNSGFELPEFVSKLVEYGFELDCVSKKGYSSDQLIEIANRGVPWLDLVCTHKPN